MNLPDLALQIVYGRLAWACVVAALLLACMPQASRRITAAAVIGSVVTMALPGAASPAYWLALAFQYPSGLLLGCALLVLADRWRGQAVTRLLPPVYALVIVAAGTLLYLDAFGVLALGLYYAGFGGRAAPLLACVTLAGCAAAIVHGRGTRPALALMAGLLLYSLPRLPTGNLWDALLDPLLWTWALVSAVVALARVVAGWRVRPVAPAAQTEPVPVGAIEQLQTARE